MAVNELNSTEKILQKALINKEYEQAQTILTEYKKDIRLIYQCIFSASIAFALGNKEQAWANIAQGLQIDGSNYELYMMLGDYYCEYNLQQAYLCYENALFHCEVEEDRMQIQEVLNDFECQGIRVPKAAIGILSYNLLEMT